jgi:dTDP-4-dehydrorhamnose reductase
MRILIFGATGMLGKSLTEEWSGEEVIGLGSKDADIRDAAQVSAVIAKSRPEWIVLSAAYTDVDGCELDPERAMAVNCQGPIHVAKAAREAGSRLLFVSTDYVFDGEQSVPYEANDPRNPISVYGRSKAEAEVAVLEILPESCIARVSWLFGPGGKSFPDAILANAGKRPEISVVNDQCGCPTYTPDVAKAFTQLIQQNAKGIVHAINRGQGSRFDLAREVVAAAGLPTKVVPTGTENIVKRPARRPKYSVLSSKSLEPYGITFSSWEDAVRRFLQTKPEFSGATVQQ